MTRRLWVSRRWPAKLVVLLGMVALGVIGMHVLSSGHQLVDATGSGHVARVIPNTAAAAAHFHRHDQHDHLGATEAGSAAESASTDSASADSTGADSASAADAVELWAVNVPLSTAAGVLDRPTPGWLSPESTHAVPMDERQLSHDDCPGGCGHSDMMFGSCLLALATAVAWSLVAGVRLAHDWRVASLDLAARLIGSPRPVTSRRIALTHEDLSIRRT